MINNINILKIINIISEESGIDVLSEHRSKHKILIRQAIYSNLHKIGFSYPEIGEIFNKHHTTILYGVKTIKFNNPYIEFINKFIPVILTPIYPEQIP